MGRNMGGTLAGVLGALVLATTAQAATTKDDVYGLVKGCYALSPAVEGGPFRFQATDLGRYMLYGKAGDFVVAGGGREAEPSPASDFAVAPDGDGFSFTAASGEKLGTFELTKADGCATFPEVELSATGEPGGGPTPYSETRGFIDAHMHLLAYEFLGGKLHCGRPWHRYGVMHALPDCNENPAEGAGTAIAEAVLSGETATDGVGWPTFRQWPRYDTLAHEASYYRWLERAWLGGLRLYVALFVDNEVLCKVYPFKVNPCNDMHSVRLQNTRIEQLQDYIDAQAGGPGKGFFRIVRDPFEARRVINAGKLAVIKGIEVSRLFECGLKNGVPQCDKEQIDAQLDEVHRMGVRQMELINKFDNAFGGVAGDSGASAYLVNNANKGETGRYWDMRSCDGEDKAHVHDREQPTVDPTNTPEQDGLIAGTLAAFGPPGTAPIYGPGPHCNSLGLSDLGEHVVRRMMAKGMVIDPDHLSVAARRGLLAVTEAEDYPGLVSSHSWSTPDAELRILRRGGVVTPYAGSSRGFVKKWRELQPMMAEGRRNGFYVGFGYGADANGFGTQGPPRGASAENPVTYPFKSFDGQVTLDKQRSGERVFDINRDGVAHYGLYPDWVEDLRKLAGDGIVADMARGAEAYLQMWERAVGISAPGCRSSRLRVGGDGIGSIRLGVPAEELLRGAGQPRTRKARRWTYCVRGRGNGKARLRAAFDSRGTVALVASDAPHHRVAGIGRGSRLSQMRGTRRFGAGLRVREAGDGRRYLYGISKAGRVRYVAVAAKGVAATRVKAREALRTAGLR